ncbi:hypothetical protein H072_3421 [Dactylellina haptotyla CBS 200.50]|uniref:Initiator tRNA phosphoribosyl transferase n=1 Tax=Dactylellina haptotyla (strain CBS 200.50) TaxID=1284197 RepID=S8AI90_DACHA|nr:hypothetical protein H072_3421 [Dactylellina haptotyla CBS 200.50]
MSFFKRPTDDSSSDDDDEEADEEIYTSGSDSENINQNIQSNNGSEDEDELAYKPAEISDDAFQPLSINAIANTIRKSDRLSISNRLHSINEDSAFVQAVAGELNLPLIANERCGSWYVPPEKKAGSCYFKSTDGHFGCWSFSSRRLNLGLLKIIGAHGGCIIVDSTRRGKSIPDALSKTVPIWCAVMNAGLFPERKFEIDLPENAVSGSEKAQINSLFSGFVQQLHELNLDLQELATGFQKPMKPIWITRDSDILDEEYLGADFYPVYLLSASKYLQKELQPRDSGIDGHNFVYIQGAGDDHEGWARGLLPVTYWKHRERLLQTPEVELPDFINGIIRSHGEENTTDTFNGFSILNKVLGKLAICDLRTYEALGKSQTPIVGAIVCTDQGSILEKNPSTPSDIPLYQAVIPSNKSGSKLLRAKLAEIVAFAQNILSSNSPSPILVACQTGNDISVGIALALVARLFDDQGRLISASTTSSNPQIDKTIIRQRLGWIISDRTQANPSRATLQAVNLYLMGWA